jgi:membrane protein insertase Oxa1/YidC/SpoIIIJ
MWAGFVELIRRPAIEALQKRYAKDPASLMRETQTLYAANGIRILSPIALIGLLLQLPLLTGLLSAVRSGLGVRIRFLWIADLARPDALLLLAVTAITAGTMTMMPTTQEPSGASSAQFMLLLSVVATLVFLWSASSAIALSVGAGSLVSALQNWLLSRDRVPLAPSA